MLTQSCFFVRSYTSHRLRGKKLLSSDKNKIHLLRSSFDSRSKQKTKIMLMSDCSKKPSTSKLQKVINSLNYLSDLSPQQTNKLVRKRYSYDLSSQKDKSKQSKNSLRESIHETVCQEKDRKKISDSINVSTGDQGGLRVQNKSIKKIRSTIDRKEELLKRLKSTYQKEKFLDRVISEFEIKEDYGGNEEGNANENSLSPNRNKIKRKYRNNSFFKSYKVKHERQEKPENTTCSSFSSQNNLVRLLHTQERLNRTSECLSRRRTIGMKPGRGLLEL